MADLVGDLLELSRLESGTLELEIEPFSVAEAAARVVGGLLPIALECDIRLRTTLPPRLQSATGDRRRVEQILTNLVANALKFTAPGGSVEITAASTARSRSSSSSTTAPGIAAEDRGRIFERFHRLEAHERITGTGLGLPIARDLARRMGGDLEVASVPGIGFGVRPRPSGPGRDRLRRSSPRPSPRALARRRSGSRSGPSCGRWPSPVAAAPAAADGSVGDRRRTDPRPAPPANEPAVGRPGSAPRELRRRDARPVIHNLAAVGRFGG